MLWSAYRGQLAVALVLVLLLAALLAAAAVVLLRVLVRKISRRPAPRRFRWVRRTVLIAAAAALLCIAYGCFVEPYWLEVTDVHVPTAKLAPGSRPIRIVQLSDLHCESKARLEPGLPAIIAGLKPDLIVFTGDAANSAAGLERFHQCMTELAAIAPTFAVKGNWDYWVWAEPFVRETGVQELTSQAIRVQVAGTDVYLVGAPADHWADIRTALAAVPREALKVVLYHYPDRIPDAAQLGVDLYLCGHTHGGQIALPLYGAIVTLSTHGKEFEAGLYHVGQTSAYVNRGIGMEGGHVPRVRFFARPEVTLIELVTESR